MLVGAAWSGAVRIGKEDPDRERLCQALVRSHLVASIVGPCVAQRGGHVAELVRITGKTNRWLRVDLRHGLTLVTRE